MLGYSALGRFALGQGPPQSYGNAAPKLPGSGKRYAAPTDYLPEPAYDKAPNKPSYPPIWDREAWRKRHAAVVEEPTAPPKPAGPPPLPPLSLFGQSAPVQVMSPAGLPTFNEYAPPDALSIGTHLQRALDESDALAALRALGLIKDE